MGGFNQPQSDSVSDQVFGPSSDETRADEMRLGGLYR